LADVIVGVAAGPVPTKAELHFAFPRWNYNPIRRPTTAKTSPIATKVVSPVVAIAR